MPHLFYCLDLQPYTWTHLHRDPGPISSVLLACLGRNIQDASFLVNRLYYAVPRFENGRFQCSFFYEENTFSKEANGDLTLVRTEYGVEAT